MLRKGITISSGKHCWKPMKKREKIYEVISVYYLFLKKVNIFDFFYLNYFCKSIIRTDHYKVIPYKNTVIEIPKTAKIYVESGDIEIGCDVLRNHMKKQEFD